MSEPASKRTFIPRLAVFCAVDMAAVAGLGFLGAYFGALEPQTGLLIFGIGLVFGSLFALVIGTVGLFLAGDRHPERLQSLTGVVVGSGGLLLTVFLLMSARNAPMIHDTTTDPSNPPRFRAIAELPENAGRDLSYPHGASDSAVLQARAYPDLAPLRVELPAPAALAAAQQTAESLGWTIVAVDEEAGILEAYDATPFFRFIDDVVVRVRAVGADSMVDVRSTSRVGQGDLGVNARRIREFMESFR